MDWTNILTTAMGLLLGGSGSILYFRPKLKEAQVGAAKAQTQYLEERIDSISKLYSEQGNKVDQLCNQVTDLKIKILEKETRIATLEAENKKLTLKLQEMEEELSAYRIINHTVKKP